MGKNQHVTHREDGWAVKSAGSARATAVLPTKAAAVDRAREIAINQKSEMIVHKADGTIQCRNSYGNDPCPPRDKK